MTKATTKDKLPPFDAARYLIDDAAVAEYVTAVLETDDADLLLLALGDVARARGMAQVAKDAGLGRESLYTALTPGANAIRYGAQGCKGFGGSTYCAACVARLAERMPYRLVRRRRSFSRIGQKITLHRADPQDRSQEPRSSGINVSAAT